MIFKPDFTKNNPYENAPLDYIGRIKGTPAYQAAIDKGWIVEKTPKTAPPPDQPPAKPETPKEPDIKKQPAASADTPSLKTEFTEEQQRQAIAFEQLTSNPDFVAGMEKVEQDQKKEQQKQQGIVFEQLTSNPDFVAGMEKVAKEQQQRQMYEVQRQLSENPDFANNTILLGDGTYMPMTDYNALSVGEKTLARNKGVAGLQEYWNRMNIPKYTLPDEVKEFYEKTATPEEKFDILMSYDKIPQNAVYTGSKNGEPMYRMGSGIDAAVMSPEFRNILVETMVPLVYTINHWDELSAGEKALNLALDALFFVPLVGVASKGAKATSAVTRLGRLKGAAHAVSTELLMQSKAPIDIMMHPVQSVKGTARQAWDTLENIANYRKIPEAVITTTNGTVRIPVTKTLNAADAARIRTQIMKEAAETGADIAIEFNGQRFTVSRSALMKELGGGFSHATPKGDNFLKGLKVAPNEGKGLAEQGLFVSHEPLPKFSQQSAFGKTGEMPTIFITSPETAAKAINTNKIYTSPAGKVAELERKFPVGFEFTEPKQILYTRVGPERVKTMIMLEKPLTLRQIAKLKTLALVEDLKAPFKPSLLIEGKQSIKGANNLDNVVDSYEFREITRVLERSGNKAQARNLKAVWDGLNNARAATRQGRQSGNVIGAGLITSYASGKSNKQKDPATISPDDIVDAYDNDPDRREVFQIRAEKIGRSARTSKPSDNPRAVRIENPEAAKRVERKYSNNDTKTARSERGSTRNDSTTPRSERGSTRNDSTTPRSERGSTREDRREPRTTGDITRKAQVTARKDKDDSDGTTPSEPKKESPEWDAKKIESAIAWKDGFVVHAIAAPYRRGIDERTFHIDHLPPGLNVQDITGKGSQEATLTVKGKPPKKMEIDVGNQDVLITRKGENTVSIRHVRDTTGTQSRLTIKRQKPLKRKSKGKRVFRTKVSGNEVVSRRPINGY